MRTNPNSLANLKQGNRPTKYKHSPTKAIRIPIQFEQLVLNYVATLDNDNRSVQGSVEFSLSEIIQKINAKKVGYKPNSASQLIADLKNLTGEI